MKDLKIKAQFIIKSDLIKMLEAFTLELKRSDTVYFNVESNIGGKMTASIMSIEPLEDLRKPMKL